jgi:integrase
MGYIVSLNFSCYVVFRCVGTFAKILRRDLRMASYRDTGKGWQVQVCVNGVRKSATFPTKRAASRWASAFELEVQDRAAGIVPDVPFSSLLERYRDEVSCKKRGAMREARRIAFFLHDPLASVRLVRLSSPDFAAWRDRRLRVVSPSSVLRDWTLLNHVLTVAIKEWRLLQESPLKGVSKPKAPLPRDRRISDDEIARMLHGFGYAYDKAPCTTTSRVGAAFLFAIETAMRAGEIAALTWDAISGSVAYLPITKNGFPRHVPLSVEARRILGQLPKDGGMSVFGLKVGQIDALFRKVRSRAMIHNLHFHDTRHEAITRLARKLDVLDLARMVGIRDLRMLMVYYNARPEDIAVRLD